MSEKPIDDLEKTKRYFREILAGLHNQLLKNKIRADDLDIGFLENRDTEAEIHLPEFDVNLFLWSRWSVEKRLEVLLHELAHVMNYSDNHQPSFWKRVADLVKRVASCKTAVEEIMGARFTIADLQRCVVNSVHEEEIDPRMDSVQKRRRYLRKRFGLRLRKSGDED